MKRFIIIILVLIVVGIGFYFGYQKAMAPKPLLKSATSLIDVGPGTNQDKQFKIITTGLNAFYVDHNKYPDNLNQLTSPIAYLSADIVSQAENDGFKYVPSADRQKWQVVVQAMTYSMSSGIHLQPGQPAPQSKQKIYQLMPMNQSQTLTVISPGSGTPAKTYMLSLTPDLVIDTLETTEVAMKPNPITGKENPVLALQLNATDAGQFAQLTNNHINQLLVMKVDNEVISMPKIMQQITSGKLMIPQDGSKEEAEQLIQKINNKGIELYCVQEK
jgi:preprotein translocase subunit SecD